MPKTSKTMLVEITRTQFWQLQNAYDAGVLQVIFGEIIVEGRTYKTLLGEILFKDDGKYYWASPRLAKILSRFEKGK